MSDNIVPLKEHKSDKIEGLIQEFKNESIDEKTFKKVLRNNMKSRSDFEDILDTVEENIKSVSVYVDSFQEVFNTDKIQDILNQEENIRKIVIDTFLGIKIKKTINNSM